MPDFVVYWPKVSLAYLSFRLGSGYCQSSLFPTQYVVSQFVLEVLACKAGCRHQVMWNLNDRLMTILHKNFN